MRLWRKCEELKVGLLSGRKESRAKVKNVEKQIWDVEGFDVVINRLWAFHGCWIGLRLPMHTSNENIDGQNNRKINCRGNYQKRNNRVNEIAEKKATAV
jgi:hypothetical protein